MLFAALIGVIAATAPPPKPLSTLNAKLQAQCQNADTVVPDLAAGLQALKANDGVLARSKFDGIVANCGVAPASYIARAIRADLALKDKDYDLALKLLGPVPRPARKPIGARSSWTAMQAFIGKGDAAGFQGERARLLAAVDRTLGPDGPYQGRKIESFDVNGTQVTAYEARLTQGAFVRLTEFIIVPPGPMALPRSVLLTDDVNARTIMKQTGAVAAPDFVDQYDCNQHVTLKMLPAPDGQAPPYADVKALVVAFLQGSASGVSSMTPGADNMSACHWPQYVTPGFDN